MIIIILIIALLRSAAVVEATTATSYVEQRSKETNCLIIGYQNCILNLTLSVSNGNDTSTEKSAIITNVNTDDIMNRNLLLKMGAAKCWQISDSRDMSLSCGDNECPWSGQCTNALIDENDGYHKTENLPISAFYDDAHTITISFPTYLDTMLYVLESRPLSVDEKIQNPWTFAGVSNQTSISYRILDVCHKYEFRTNALLTNGTVISFLPKVPSANPPDFIVETLKLDKLYFDEKRHVAVAIFAWKTPYGYTTKDITKYDSYLHPIECDLSADYDISKQLIKTDDGGAFKVEFPENMIKRKCRFMLAVWAFNSCNSKTVADARADLELSCSRIENYNCPSSELKPKCLLHIVTNGFQYNTLNNQISVNATWLPSNGTKPEYYHVKWGLANLVDLQPRPPPPPPLPSQRSRDEPVGDGRPRVPNFDISIWILDKNSVRNEKVDGANNTVTLSGLNLNQNYGIQVCAVYNFEFKSPEWMTVPVSGFTCVCNGDKCNADSSVTCQDPDWFKLNKNPFVATSSPQTTTVALVVTAKSQQIAPMKSSTIGTVEDFFQALVGWEYLGLRMRLNWNPPQGVSPNQMNEYRLTLLSLNDCVDAQLVCCNFAKFPDMKQASKNSSEVSLLVPKDVLRANCQFMVKIISSAVNGAESISLNNIVVPKPVVDDFNEKAATVSSVYSAGFAKPNNFGASDGTDLSSDKMETKSDDFDDETVSRTMFNCTSLGCSHLCTDKICLCPEGFLLTNDSMTCIIDESYDRRHGLGNESSLEHLTLSHCHQMRCQYSCNSRNECVCPSAMQLAPDKKICIYKDPDLLNMTAPPPKVTTTRPPGFYCLENRTQISVFQTSNGNFYLIWSNQSWVGRMSEIDYKSPVIVRWGETKTVPFVNLLKIINDTWLLTTDLSARKLLISRANIEQGKQYGFQFCVIIDRSFSKDFQWSLFSVLPLTPTTANPEVAPGSVLPSRSEASDNETNNDWKKIIAMAVVIPLCCLVIVISLSILLCHFYPGPFRKIRTKLFCSKKSRCHSDNVDTDKTRTSTSTSTMLSVDDNRQNSYDKFLRRFLNNHPPNVIDPPIGDNVVDKNTDSERVGK